MPGFQLISFFSAKNSLSTSVVDLEFWKEDADRQESLFVVHSRQYELAFCSFLLGKIENFFPKGDRLTTAS
jgi:hypothetical protein